MKHNPGHSQESENKLKSNQNSMVHSILNVSTRDKIRMPRLYKILGGGEIWIASESKKNKVGLGGTHFED